MARGLRPHESKDVVLTHHGALLHSEKKLGKAQGFSGGSAVIGGRGVEQVNPHCLEERESCQNPSHCSCGQSESRDQGAKARGGRKGCML